MKTRTMIERFDSGGTYQECFPLSCVVRNGKDQKLALEENFPDYAPFERDPKWKARFNGADGSVFTLKHVE